MREKKYSYLFLVVILSLFCFLFQSCSSEKELGVKTYSLGMPEQLSLGNIVLYITPLLNYSETTTQMFYRLDDNQVEYDPYNSWAKTPNYMLTTFIKRSLCTKNYVDVEDKNTLIMTLVGSVTDFEIDLKNNKAILGMDYKVMYQGKLLLCQNRVFEQSFKNKTPEEFAAAMTEASIKFVTLLHTQLLEAKNKISY